MALGERAEMASRDALLRRVLFPRVVLGVHHERGAVAWGRVGEALAGDVLPDRLIAVLVEPGAGGGVRALAAEHAALEHALLLELGERLGHLAEAHEPVAAGAAELHHHAEAGDLRVLRPVGNALGEIADAARPDRLVGRDADLALEADADLVEIVAVARREEPAVLAPHAEMVIVPGAFAPDQQVTEVDAAAAMPRDAFPRGFVAVLDVHARVPPRGSQARRRRS